ncbi:MAG: NAD(P)H-dependent oxidoreductase [Patescibacteria group bacterium]|nr:NAD(P)H-dependent oxidoreductase [Patescibacteria group bacterium]
MKKILVIKAHPREESFCNALVARYIDGAKASGAEVKVLNLRELELEPWLKYEWGGGHDSLPDSDDLEHAKELIEWSEHIMFAYPIYWAMPPALLTLFIELVTASGFAFKYRKPLFGIIPRWDKLLAGRTASVISTMDAPPLFFELHDHDPAGKMLKDVLRFTGIRLVGKYYFGSVVLSGEKRKARWLEKAFAIGKTEGR